MCQFPQNFGTLTNFLETFESLLPQIIPNVRKIFPKYRKNFLKIACFKSFLTDPLNFLRISEYIQISCKLSNPVFLKLFPILGKVLPHIFTELCVSKFARSSLLKIFNSYFLKLFPYAAPLHHHCHAAPPPPSSHLPWWKFKCVWMENKVNRR